MKFLIIQTAFIGDVILATPIIEKLHHHHPEAKIDFMLRKGNETLLDNHPIINQVHMLDKSSRKYTHLFQIIKKIRKEKYDHVINVQRFLTTGLIAALSGAKTITGFDKNPLSFLFHKKVNHQISIADKDNHEVKRNLSLIHEISDDQFFRPEIYPAPEDFDKIKTNGKYICIAPASIWFTKQWPAEKWKSFIDKIPEKYNIYLLGSSKDSEICTSIQEKTANPKVINLAGQLSFLESAALMKKANMNYVNDSAPLHFASAVNAPVTAVFCSTVPEFGFGPLSDVSYTVETDEKLECRPCGLHGKKACPLGHFKCADIDVKKMLDKTKKHFE